MLYGAVAGTIGGWIAAALLVAAALALTALALRRGPAPSAPARRDPPVRADPPRPNPVVAAERAPLLLELARRAAGADEAALWRLDAPASVVRCAARATGSEQWTTPAAVALDDGAFSAAIAEQLHMRLERGQRDLPAPWAAEMLLVPLGRPGALLSLAYTYAAPASAESAAVTAAEALRAAGLG